MLWFTFHDNILHTESNMNPLRVAIKCQMFAFNCGEGPLSNTIFAQNTFGNSALENADSLYFGVFADFDIGNPDDNFYGCDPSRKMFFGYNGDDTDEGFYENEPPVMAIDFVRSPLNEDGVELSLSHLMPVGDVGSFPSSASFYNVLTGSRPDGTPAPNDGLFYDGNPNDPSAWPEVSDNNIPGDRRVVGSTGPFKLQPGAVNQATVAFSFLGKNGNTPLQNVQDMYNQSDGIQTLMDYCLSVPAFPDHFSFAVTGTSEARTASLDVYPNPATDKITIQLHGQLNGTIKLTDLNGKTILSQPVPLHSGQMELNTAGLAQGMYLLTGTGKEGTIYREKVVLTGF